MPREKNLDGKTRRAIREEVIDLLEDEGVPAVRTEKLRGSHNRLIETTADLESLPSDIEAGETVSVAQPDTPYRPESWPDGGKRGQIDVSDIKIVFESKYAANGERIVKPADGSDIGGLAFGLNSAISNIEVHGLGYHGNESTMDDGVTGLCAILIGDVTDAKIWDFDITRTHPYHVHNALNSGIIILGSLGRVSGGPFSNHNIDVAYGKMDEIGDRCVMMGEGHDISVRHCRFTNGFDRAITYNSGLSHSLISDIYVKDLAEGSVIKAGACTDLTIENVVGIGLFRGFIQLGFRDSGGGDNVIRGCYCRHTATDGTGGAVSAGVEVCPDDTVEGNTIICEATGGEEFIQTLAANSGDPKFLDNTIRTEVADGALANAGSPKFKDNTFDIGKAKTNAGRIRLNTSGARFIDNEATTYKGVNIGATDVVVEGNHISLYDQGVPLNDTSDPSGSVIRDNVFEDVDTKFGSQGCINITQSGATDVLIEQNVERDNPNAAHFINLMAAEVCVRDNASMTGSVTFWNVDTANGNAPVEASGNSTRYLYESAPGRVRNYVEYLASSSWDPNSTGGDSVVMTADGGSSWNNVVVL